MNHKSFAIYFMMLWLLFFAVIPLCFILIASFLSEDHTHLMNLPLTLNNYTTLWTMAFLKVFLRSLLQALLTAFFCLILAFPFCYLLIKSKHQSILLLLIMIPFWTSSLVRTYALVSILKYHGLINLILIKLHIITEPLHLLYTNTAVLSGLVYSLFPFMVLPIFTQMERFDFRWIEAAKDLGANTWHLFFRVFLPNNLAGIIAGCLMIILPAMTMFYIPNILGGARAPLLGNMIQSQFLVLENWPQGAATSAVLTILFVLILWILRIEKPKRPSKPC